MQQMSLCACPVPCRDLLMKSSFRKMEENGEEWSGIGDKAIQEPNTNRVMLPKLQFFALIFDLYAVYSLIILVNFLSMAVMINVNAPEKPYFFAEYLLPYTSKIFEVRGDVVKLGLSFWVVILCPILISASPGTRPSLLSSRCMQPHRHIVIATLFNHL